MTGRIDSAGLSGMVGALTEAHGVPGAQFTVLHEGELVAVAVGEAEHGSGRPVTPDVAFPVGSIGKTFTAAVVMVLAADGDLGLDDPVGEYVPETAGRPIAAVTPRQLLSHTGGLESGPEGGPSMRGLVERTGLIQPPGGDFSYSNAGFVLLGRLAETVTGMSWFECVESILLRPLGIAPAFVVGPRTARPVATGHAGRARPVTQNITLAEAPAGAIAASASDLVALGRMLVDGGGILSHEDARRMRQPVADAFGLADAWGLGLALFGTWAGHDGTGDGTWCQLRIDPDRGTVAALTCNSSAGAGLWDDVVAELGRRGLPIPSGSLTAVPDVVLPPPDGWSGSFHNGDTEYSISADMVFAVDGEPQAMITFHEGLTFSLRDNQSGQQLYAGRCLVSPETGKIDRIHVNGRLALARR
ncbi:serine hydrolase domain-containing protein [Actinosynnema sp. ALI-1.44]|uniref:serine hydrolase domain-containing protein n=1 Tax=Actinosynnema sp. ALI-1.44 TaxID=1933779 RepID=UPI000A06A711|nr:serine hydrolase domain-containing protein [Actinosynnema sp. ALI-1.44]